MKKLLILALFMSFFACGDALSLGMGTKVTILSSSHSTTRNTDHSNSLRIDKLIGKEIQKCKIIDALYAATRKEIHLLCIRDNHFYYLVNPVYTFPYDCKGFMCEVDELEKDLINLFKVE